MHSRSIQPFEVRCPLHGSVPFSEKERRIIDHPYVQRLRYITQLGFASLVYPGATHTRFSHSLGVMHLAGLIFDEISANTPELSESAFSQEELEYFRSIVRLAGLLHDVGHPPFSHSFEKLLPERDTLPLPLGWYRTPPPPGRATHEDISVAVTGSLAGGGSPLLNEEEARDICALIDQNISPGPRLAPPDNPERNIYPLLRQIISGEIDADRMDYLRRDAHFAGVAYGLFDLPRLMQSLSCRLQKGGWGMVLDQNALFTYENFLMARFHMAMQVYLHKTVIPFEHYLLQAVRQGEIPSPISGSLEEYLETREEQVLALLHKARQKPWSGRIFHRRPVTRLLKIEQLQALESPGSKTPDPGLAARVLQALEKAGIEPIHISTSRRFSNLDAVSGEGNDGAALPIQVCSRLLARDLLTPLHKASGLLERYNQLFTIESVYCTKEDAPRAVEVLSQEFAGILPR
ncbi:MAG: HD domain-containing protein [Deltaproteobacteria bacterium]|nr:HD domain-containing protein [Deltaproteobacteria bacterium]